MTKNVSEKVIRNYFVDEAGDGTLFTQKGRVVIGTKGCSRFFILGLLDIPAPDSLGAKLENLRTRLLADPYFKGIPSMQPERRKTALVFHAKNDLPEVRREVFTLLKEETGVRFFAIVTDKLRVLEYVRQRNERDTTYRYHPNELYDFLVRRLFRDRLHKDSGYYIHFSKRGKSDRTAALKSAIELARQHFYEKWGISSHAPVNIIAGSPAQYAGLQAVDYFMWALQRLYELGEERYVSYLWNAFRLVHDIDDTRRAGYGEYYTQKNPLTRAALQGRS
jgi:hypothetical protein